VFLLLSFGLVVVAAGLFVVGVVGGNLAAVYLSMAASGAAGLALMVSARLGRERRGEASSAPAPIEPADKPGLALVGAPAGTSAAPATTAGATSAAAPPSSPPAPAAPAAPSPAPAPKAAAKAPPPPPRYAASWEQDLAVEFPIADYDDLTEDEIVPLLPELDEEELDMVEERERLTKSRPTVLAEIDRARAAALDSPAAPEPAAAAPAREPAAAAPEPAAAPEAAAAPEPAAAREATAAPAAAAAEARAPAAAAPAPEPAPEPAAAPVPAQRAEAEPAAAGPEPAPAAAQPAAATGGEAPAGSPDGAAAASPAAPPDQAEPSDRTATAGESLPIPDLHSRRANEVVVALGSLDVAQLEAVRAEEEAGARRRTVLAAVDRRLAKLRGRPSG
jgi:hypothetical protein